MVLKSFDLTHVQYDSEDRFGSVIALITLCPIYICVMYATLIISRRDFQTIYACIGQMISVGINLVLKHTLKQPRPIFHGMVVDNDDHGMPSNHAQFMFHFAIYYCMQLLFRSWSLPFQFRVIYSLLVVTAAVTVCYTRIHLQYHNVEQVLVGALIGSATGFIWFVANVNEISVVFCRQEWAQWLGMRDYSGKLGSYAPIDEYELYAKSKREELSWKKK
jgi:dolichyldiphosphatase